MFLTLDSGLLRAIWLQTMCSEALHLAWLNDHGGHLAWPPLIGRRNISSVHSTGTDKLVQENTPTLENAAGKLVRMGSPSAPMPGMR